jgi:hypothetical protein
VDRKTIETLIGFLALGTLVGLGAAKQGQQGLAKLGLLSQELLRRDTLPVVDDQTEKN